LRKDGLWTVPPYLRLEGDVGTIRIDFQRAQAAAYLIDVEIIGGAGSITLIMPAGWAVNSDRLRGFSSHRSAVAASPAAGSPLLALHGHLGLGSLRIRHPKRRDKRRLARQLRLEQERLR
jgi:hypothetical protein